MYLSLNKKTITLLLAACFIFTFTQASEQDSKVKSFLKGINSRLVGLNRSIYSANNYIAGFVLGTAQGVVDGAVDAGYKNSNTMRGLTRLTSWHATGQIIQKIQPRKIVYTVTSHGDNRSFSWKMKTSKDLGPNPAHIEMLRGRWTAQTIASCVDFSQMKFKWSAFDFAMGVSIALQVYDYVAWKYIGNVTVEEKIVVNNNKA